MGFSAILVEDSMSLGALYSEYLCAEGAEVTHVNFGEDALKELARKQPDLLVLDIKLPDMSGMDILTKVQKEYPNITVIMITAHGTIDLAVDAMRAGAFDFLIKPFDSKRLSITVRNALKQRDLLALVSNYENSLPKTNFHGFIGDSLAMQTVYNTIDCVANSKASVFVVGESGTGKEVCAQAIHEAGIRSEEPFIALNCASIPKDLIESEIFGHTKGAFTGAVSHRDGAATRADGGTLFLDELCEMDLELQSKLLRFIQTGVFQRVGGSKEEKVDVRFISATNRDPWKEVQDGRFREDLYYRLHVIPIELPPLRQRGKDVISIAKKLLKQYSKEEGKTFKRFSSEVERCFTQYSWPGNVRQLQNVIRQVVVLNIADEVAINMLPAQVTAALSQAKLDSKSESQVNPIAISTVTEINAKSQELIRDGSLTASDAAIGGNTSANQSNVSSSAVALAEPVDVIGSAEDIQPLWLTEKITIETAIEQCDGNIPKAAALLDVSPSTIYRKKQQWEDKGL
ncbi:sigma-54 dependent transcriptional regulator [Shewanella sp. 1_MG-2023]|uniref:sigma-54-dependent transcriptional regulator n=1 Tax=unclassified Shewanella TaxID=196818 RepID=UPI0026E183DA|nr:MULTISPECIES: sigma-54 dependent transcriptional regulator [unclassified Shewanella]MDO6611629.1 sigma-54 dependent transcriptional regulator [Shewanella sp. 7_MG-2023]MDO6771484.1 sigma-54 dependent transcriptional regulator [Shewanella sp. 2_MG-2023]MDO6793867.1 sigma-54 dependent transcriptional regulator [Shewanella sp. 1_MG-2023]